MKQADDFGRAVLFMMAAALVLPLVGACAKYLSSYPITQVTWARYAGHFAFMLMVFVPRSGVDLLRSSQVSLQLVRSTLHCASAMMSFYALAFVALPTATAISFSAPLMVTAFAPLLLGEKVRPSQWVAVTTGFIGTLVVLRPGSIDQHWAVLILLASAALTGLVQILSRKLARSDSAVISNTYMVLVGFVITSLPLPSVWHTPTTLLDTYAFIVIGVAGGFGHYLVVRAFELAPAASISPFNYGQILGATLLSYFVFGFLPDVWTWVGVAIISVSGVFILYRSGR
jgi:drug/metabolite transporter (DMT)-like permease